MGCVHFINGHLCNWNTTKNHLSYMIKAAMKKKISHSVMSVSLLLQTTVKDLCKVARSKAVTLLGVLPFFFFLNHLPFPSPALKLNLKVCRSVFCFGLGDIANLSHHVVGNPLWLRIWKRYLKTSTSVPKKLLDLCCTRCRSSPMKQMVSLEITLSWIH